MASEVHAILVDPVRHAESLVRGRLDELEHRWSRFMPDSDITRLNTAPGVWVAVSPDTLALLSAMKQAWRFTDGRYDPTMLAALLEAGYSASADGSARTSLMADARPTTASIDDVVLDPAASSARLPHGVGLDPGGIGKGLAADLLAGELLEGGCAGALVSIGGDLAAAGRSPSEGGWFASVEDPIDQSRVLATLEFEGGGIATSSTRSRAWICDGHRVHHVLDPTTRECSVTDLAAVTVVAGTGWAAEAHATAALLAGSEAALNYVSGHDLLGVVTTCDGATTMSPGLEREPAGARSAS